VRPYLEKPFTEIGLVEWLKVEALSSNSSTTEREKKRPCLKRVGEGRNEMCEGSGEHRGSDCLALGEDPKQFIFCYASSVIYSTKLIQTAQTSS
jgi:hypothetical protein